MIEGILQVVSNLPLEVWGVGLGVIIAVIYLVGHRLKFKNDPYFPPWGAPKSEKIIVILVEETSSGVSVVDEVEGKWGIYGLYVPILDRLYQDIQFMGGKRKITMLMKGADGSFHPGGIALVKTGVEYDVEDKVIGEEENQAVVKSVKEKKTARLIKGKVPNPTTFLTLIIPSIEEYRLVMSSHIESFYQTALSSVMKNVNPAQKGFIAQWFNEMDRDKLIIIAMIFAIVVIYFLASDGITAMTRICHATGATIQGNQSNILNTI